MRRCPLRCPIQEAFLVGERKAGNQGIEDNGCSANACAA